MRAIEIACALIVAAYVALRMRGAAADRRAIAARLAWLALASWIGEDSVVRAYAFYGYSPAWSIVVDRVPLLVVLIWPVVIDSAHVLARRLAGEGASAARVALLGGAIVLADASLIEPIAVHAGLWSWSADNARSVFDVPPIGIVGWAYFAAAAIAAFELGARALVAIAAPLATHAALVASWWLAFKWVGGVAPARAPAIAAWLALAPVVALAWRVRSRVPVVDVMARAPGALFFFVLLALTARGRAGLVAYALAFAPPYLALLSPRPRAAGADRAGAPAHG